MQAVFSAIDNPKRRAYILAPLAMYHHGQPDKALELCHQVASLENISPPVRVMIRFLETKHVSNDPGATVRMVAKCIHAFHDGVTKCERFLDDNLGLKFLLAMYPSMNKSISDKVKPVITMKVAARKMRATQKSQ
jgi:hypothetical protein